MGSSAFDTGMGRSHSPASSPTMFTSTASSLTPANSSTSASAGPVHSAQPTAPVPHRPPETVRPVASSKKPRQLPAHSMYTISVRLGSAFRSSRLSWTCSRTPGPVTVSAYSSGSISGVGVWLRTKKRSFGVISPCTSSSRVSRLVPRRIRPDGSFTQDGWRSGGWSGGWSPVGARSPAWPTVLSAVRSPVSGPHAAKPTPPAKAARACRLSMGLPRRRSGLLRWGSFMGRRAESFLRARGRVGLDGSHQIGADRGDFARRGEVLQGRGDGAGSVGHLRRTRARSTVPSCLPQETLPELTSIRIQPTRSALPTM